METVDSRREERTRRVTTFGLFTKANILSNGGASVAVGIQRRITARIQPRESTCIQQRRTAAIQAALTDRRSTGISDRGAASVHTFIDIVGCDLSSRASFPGVAGGWITTRVIKWEPASVQQWVATSIQAATLSNSSGAYHKRISTDVYT